MITSSYFNFTVLDFSESFKLNALKENITHLLYGMPVSCELSYVSGDIFRVLLFSENLETTFTIVSHFVLCPNHKYGLFLLAVDLVRQWDQHLYVADVESLTEIASSCQQQLMMLIEHTRTTLEVEVPDTINIKISIAAGIHSQQIWMSNLVIMYTSSAAVYNFQQLLEDSLSIETSSLTNIAIICNEVRRVIYRVSNSTTYSLLQIQKIECTSRREVFIEFSADDSTVSLNLNVNLQPTPDLQLAQFVCDSISSTPYAVSIHDPLDSSLHQDSFLNSLLNDFFDLALKLTTTKVTSNTYLVQVDVSSASVECLTEVTFSKTVQRIELDNAISLLNQHDWTSITVCHISNVTEQRERLSSVITSILSSTHVSSSLQLQESGTVIVFLSRHPIPDVVYSFTPVFKREQPSVCVFRAKNEIEQTSFVNPLAIDKPDDVVLQIQAVEATLTALVTRFGAHIGAGLEPSSLFGITVSIADDYLFIERAFTFTKSIARLEIDYSIDIVSQYSFHQLTTDSLTSYSVLCQVVRSEVLLVLSSFPQINVQVEWNGLNDCFSLKFFHSTSFYSDSLCRSFSFVLSIQGVLDHTRFIIESANFRDLVVDDIENDLQRINRLQNAIFSIVDDPRLWISVFVGVVPNSFRIRLSIDNLELTFVLEDVTFTHSDTTALTLARNKLSLSLTWRILVPGQTITRNSALTVLREFFDYRTQEFGVSTQIVRGPSRYDFTLQRGSSQIQEVFPTNQILYTFPEFQNIEQISGGVDYTLVLGSGKLFVFGRNSLGQLGTGDYTSYWFPKRISVGDQEIVQISSGRAHSLVLSASGEVWGFGLNHLGQLGLGDYQTRLNPTRIQFAGSFVAKHVSCGWDHSGVISEANELFTFGENDYGQLGLGDTVRRANPTKVSSLEVSSGVSQMVGGESHSCALLVDTTVRCFGRNNEGQAGNDQPPHHTTPQRIRISRDSLELLSQVTKLVCTFHTNFALRTNGNLWVWGSNYDKIISTDNYLWYYPHHWKFFIVDVTTTTATVMVKLLDNSICISGSNRKLEVLGILSHNTHLT
ncbi:hypothetical protein RCL1_001673 [Eukaryota sp. TZLM3-RCL]